MQRMRRPRRSLPAMADYILTLERDSSVPRERWIARLTAPYLPVTFAQVSWAELRGHWLLQFMPRGSDVGKPVIWGDYRSKEKAMAHVELWASHHWRTVPTWMHPLRHGVR